ncbi:MAG: TadE/TadG family type IV pilus assembly protein [Actinomycetota bacterium]
MRRIRDERGASAVEFAIIASLLFMILFGTIQFGIMFNRYQGLQSGGREGARLGSLTATTNDDILGRVKDSLSIVDPANVAMCTSGSGTPTVTLDHACVRVSRRTEPDQSPDWHSVGGDPGPCNASQPGDKKSVVVEVFLRTTLDIVLWASPTMTIGGSGEFRCEG